MKKPDRRQILKSLAGLGIGTSVLAPLTAASGVAPKSSLTSRITRYEMIPTRLEYYEPVREALIKSFSLQNRMQTDFRPIIVKIYTDDGLMGICNAMIPDKHAVEAILKGMIGHSPWEYLMDDSLKGLLVAIYDLVGQATGLPVSRLFSDKPKKRIIQTWWSQCYPPDLMAKEAKRGEDLGYKVHKVKARPWEDVVEQAAAICEAVKSDFRIWVDANAWWGSVGRTIHLCEKLGQFSNYFAIESPVSRPGIASYRALKGKIPLQMSEHITDDPMPYISEGLLDSFVVGGPLGRTFVQRALMAEVTKIPLWIEHSIEDGINQVFQAHQAAAFPGVQYAISITHVLVDDLMQEPFEMKNGFYEVPVKPGLGVHLDDDAVDKYRIG
ncbi:MAG: mandelate racemase/muconate lactonizing enzyme family protein [Saprospiraceae bacterium]|nr:mandelate racemase/muconate lactonizing enzyme family protein [Saprospiraceae bacterium]